MDKLGLIEGQRNEKSRLSRIVSCGILEHEIRKLIQKGRIDAEVRFLPKNLHSDPLKLEMSLDKVLSDYRAEDGPHPVVVYGDICMGFDMEIKALVEKHGSVSTQLH